MPDPSWWLHSYWWWSHTNSLKMHVEILQMSLNCCCYKQFSIGEKSITSTKQTSALNSLHDYTFWPVWTGMIQYGFFFISPQVFFPLSPSEVACVLGIIYTFICFKFISGFYLFLWSCSLITSIVKSITRLKKQQQKNRMELNEMCNLCSCLFPVMVLDTQEAQTHI